VPSAELPQGPLFYEDSGTGVPVLLLHELGGNARDWDRQAAALASRRRVVVPELRGHGRSPPPPGDTYTPFQHAADIQGLIDRLALKRPWVVGLSLGGLVALALALDHPEQLRGIVLVSTTAHVDRYTREVESRWMKVFREEGVEAYLNRLLQDAYYPDWLLDHLDEADRFREDQRHRRLAGIAPSVAGSLSWDVRGQIARIRLPTLVVHGMDDRVVDPTSARILRQTILGSEMKLYANTGHLLHQERPEEFTRLLEDFFSRHEDTPSPSSGDPAP
jgi:pimeloyl-ACP methyl ester carboxylesterase